MLQFSLRTLLAACALLSLVMGMAAWLQWLGLWLGCGIASLVVGIAGSAGKNALQGIAGLAGALFVAAVLFLDVSCVRVWDGGSNLDFSVTVVDGASGKPIPGCRVALMCKDWEEQSLPCDARGQARMTHHFLFGGRDSGYGITAYSPRSVGLGAYAFRVVTAAGEEHWFPLDETLGRAEWPATAESHLDITLSLDSE